MVHAHRCRISRYVTCEDKDTILTAVDKVTKMCDFIPCTETVSAKDVARFYWLHVGKLHGIPQVIISDRDPRFTGKFWRELWRLLGTEFKDGLWVSSGVIRPSREIQSALGTDAKMYNTPSG